MTTNEKKKLEEDKKNIFFPTCLPNWENEHICAQKTQAQKSASNSFMVCTYGGGDN